jgi:hypothetical protein
MDARNGWHSIDEARETDMVDYLSGLGYEPSKIRNVDIGAVRLCAWRKHLPSRPIAT